MLYVVQGLVYRYFKHRYIILNRDQEAEVFDCSLSWDHHVANVCSKMSYYLYFLGSHHHVIDYSLMKMLLEFLVLSHLSLDNHFFHTSQIPELTELVIC